MTLSRRQVDEICRLNDGFMQCRYLEENELAPGKYLCIKKTARKDDKDKEIQELQSDLLAINLDLVVPIGDNCPGYPLLKHIEQGFDVR